MGTTDGKGYLAGVVEGLGDNAGLEILDNTHDIVHHDIGEGVGDLLLYQTLFFNGIVEGKGGCLLIGHDKPAGAEFYSSEVSYHYHKDIGELTAVYLPENGFASGTAGFAIVVGTEVGAIVSEHVCPTDMARVEVFLAVLRNELFHIIDCIDMM